MQKNKNKPAMAPATSNIEPVLHNSFSSFFCKVYGGIVTTKQKVEDHIEMLFQALESVKKAFCFCRYRHKILNRHHPDPIPNF